MQERVEVPLQFGKTIQHVAQQAMNEDGQKIFEIFRQEGEQLCIASWAHMRGAAERLSPIWKEDVKTWGREIQMLSKRQENFQDAIEGELSVQDRASGRMHDQIIEEIKDMEHKKTEEALNLVKKEHDLWRCQSEKRRSQKICRAPGN